MCKRTLACREASDWQFLISTYSAKDYAEIRFQDHIDRFNRLAEFAERVSTGAILTEAEEAFFADCKLKDAPFQEIRYSATGKSSTTHCRPPCESADRPANGTNPGFQP